MKRPVPICIVSVVMILSKIYHHYIH